MFRKVKQFIEFCLILLIITCIGYMTYETNQRMKKLEDKHFPKSIRCNRCGGYDISETSTNPSSQVKVKTMDELASGPTFEVVTQFANVQYYEHTLTCNRCQYRVTFTRTY